MSYTLTPEHLATITDVDMAFSTDNLLPSWDDIPPEFKSGNVYTRIAAAIFYGTHVPEGEVEMKPGFTADAMMRAVRAHLQSFSPKHEHKIAGVGYMIACACTVTADAGSRATTTA